MKMGYRVITREDLNGQAVTDHFAQDVLIGLSGSPKSLPCKYIYDEEGDRLFREITGQPEYYLTRCEHEILMTHGPGISGKMDCSRFNLVELGPGDGGKARVLMEHFIESGHDFRFVPIDICEETLKHLIDLSKGSLREVQVEGLVAEYSDGLRWLANSSEVPNFVLFLGSNIGNFNRPEARRFLYKLWNSMNHGDMVLIGFDMKKDINTLNAAYNDENGVTKKFQLNLLSRINRELGGDFDPEGFEYYGNYNVFSGAIESYLVSLADQSVYIDALKQTFDFREWEPIHTEYSYKYSRRDIVRMAEETGFIILDNYTDQRGSFTDSLWRVVKEDSP